MSRALTIHRSAIPSRDRARYLDELKVRAAHYKAARCRFWVFEEQSLPGAFMEFIEADDPQTLADAHRNAPGRLLDSMKIYQQVEIA
jgi:hypothetical protein